MREQINRERVSVLICKQHADSSVSDASPNSNHFLPASKAHICPDQRRCRGHFGPASACPTRTAEGNERLKRLCSGRRIRSDEIELHGVAPGIRHGGRWHAMRRDLQGGIAWAKRRPVALSILARNVYDHGTDMSASTPTSTMNDMTHRWLLGTDRLGQQWHH